MRIPTKYTGAGVLLAALLFFTAQPASAQVVLEDPGLHTYPVQHIQKAATVVLRDIKDDWDPVLKNVKKIHVPGQDARKDEVRRQKAEANARYDAIRDQLPASSMNASAKTATATPPTLGASFIGNSYNFADPADNAMAISAAGVVVSAMNTRIHVYSPTGQQLSATSLFAFGSSANISNFTFDPKVVYDPVADRFIIVYLAGANSNNSKVVVAFSATNDPTGAWNIYTIDGNVNNEGVWIDFPQTGLSTDEFFVTGNRFFDGGGGSSGSAVFQINKADGYSGASTLTSVTHTTSSFSVHPVEGGATLYGPAFYLIDSDLGSSNQITLHRISNTIANAGILEPPLGFNMSISYAIPPDADQRNSVNDLRTNDVRVQSSYFENNRIEFVLNSAVNGQAGIFHGTGEISPFLLSFSSFSGQFISYPGMSIAYGSVAYAGVQAASGENATYIGFNFCAPDQFPGLGACYVDETGISPMLTIRTGIAPINSADQRWGDYADAQERPGAPGEAWVAGTFGNQNQDQRTWIAQLFPPQPVAVEEEDLPAQNLQVFPNPARDRVVFQFPVEIDGQYEVVVRDLRGAVITRIVENRLVPGEARLAFNTDALAAGAYTVTVENDNVKLFTKKLTVTH